MKRFYKQAAAVAADKGWTVALDGRPVRTPQRAPLVVPYQAMAQAMAEEWQGQGEEIVPSAMPMTGLANAAIDHVTPEPDRFIAELVRFAQTDTLCYRAPPDDPLHAVQAAHWDPLLDWADATLNVRLATSEGVMPAPQDEAVAAQLKAHLAGYDPFTLAGLVSMAGLSASAIIPLAVAHRFAPAGELWDAAILEERYQIEEWGEDAEAVELLAKKQAAFDAAAQFCMFGCAAT